MIVMTKNGICTQTQESPVKLYQTCKKILIEEGFKFYLALFVKKRQITRYFSI